MANVSLVVYGPRGCGKTSQAAILMERHGLDNVIELDELKEMPVNLKHGYLFLTNNQDMAYSLARRFALRLAEYEYAIKTRTA